jgi:phage baseplate assembly protein W
MNGSDIIGQGWRFPIKVNSSGGLDWSSGPDRVRDAIWIVLSTSLGERLMRPEFGAGLKDYVFEPNSPAIRAELASVIRGALVQWEPRIDIVDVTVQGSNDQDSQVLVSIDYQIRDTNELFNMVYPFYLQEGSV